MTAIIVNPSPDGRYTVRFRYDPSVVAAIKQTVPGYARSWDAQRRCWHVEPDWMHLLAAELRRHGHQVTGVDQPPARNSETDDWARVLFRRVGPHRIEPIFRAIARVLHPDVATGDTMLMRELLDARDEHSERKTG
jgi:hypothetical protein